MSKMHSFYENIGFFSINKVKGAKVTLQGIIDFQIFLHFILHVKSQQTCVYHDPCLRVSIVCIASLKELFSKIVLKLFEIQS